MIEFAGVVRSVGVVEQANDCCWAERIVRFVNMSQSIPPRIGAFFCARLQVQVGAISLVALWGYTPSPEYKP